MLSSFLVMLFWGASAHLFIYGTFLSQWDTDFSFFAGRDTGARHAVRQDHHALRRVPAGSVLDYSVHDLIVNLALSVCKSVFISVHIPIYPPDCPGTPLSAVYVPSLL